MLVKMDLQEKLTSGNEFMIINYKKLLIFIEFYLIYYKYKKTQLYFAIMNSNHSIL